MSENEDELKALLEAMTRDRNQARRLFGAVLRNRTEDTYLASRVRSLVAANPRSVPGRVLHEAVESATAEVGRDRNAAPERFGRIVALENAHVRHRWCLACGVPEAQCGPEAERPCCPDCDHRAALPEPTGSTESTEGEQG